MRKIAVIGLLLIHIAFASHSQSLFSKQNLEKASPELLKVEMNEAKSQRLIGAILSVVGPVSYLTVGSMLNNGTMDLDAAGTILLFGTISSLIGIPIFIVNSTRVNRIKHTLSERAFIEMAPCSFQNPLAQNLQTGVTLRIRF
jgi:hypothetical protein